MAFRTLVNNFTAGELDPRFLAMVDYENYHKGSRSFKQVVCIPQGGCTRRFGTNYTDVIVDRANGNAPITDKDLVRMLSYEFGADEKYDIIIRPDSTLDGGQPVNIAFDIYLGDVLVDTVYPPANTYTTAQIRDLRWAASTNRIIIYHNDVKFHQLVRTAFNNWAVNTITLQFYPGFDYTELDAPAQPYTSSGETFTPTATSGAVTVARSAGTSTPFTDNHVGGLIYGNSGVVRITTINSNISVTGYTLLGFDFENTNAIRGDELLILEKAWGDGSASVVAGASRGWPGHGTFYQGRQVMANWKYEPGRGSASVVNAAFNFDDHDDDPSTGYSFEAGKDGNDVIQDVIGYKSLVTIGFKGPSATSILLDAPTTPTNVFVNPQGTERGAKIDGKIVNNQILYIDYTYDKVYSMFYDVPDTGYNVIDISSRSAHLITEARWADVFTPAEKDGKYYILVNEDGTLAVLLMIAEENIRSWSQCYTVGSFTDVAAAGDECKAIVERQINTGATIGGVPDKVYSVEPTFNIFTDVSSSVEAATNVTFYSVDSSYIVVGNEIQFTKIDVEFNTFASTDVGLVFEYLDDTGTWITFAATDGTTGFTVDGEISWDYSDVPNWEAQTLSGVARKYWIRISRTTDTVATAPIVDLFRINTATRLYRESLNFDIYMDCQINTTSDANGDITGLDALAGQLCFVFANDFPVGSYIVASGGTLALGDTYASADISIGIDYAPEVIPMPVVGFLQNGYNTYQPQHIDEAFIDYYESLGITANGQQVVPENNGAFMTVAVPTPVTGFYEIPVHKGWDPRQEIVISQSYPAPMTLLGIGLTVEVT